MHTLNIEAKDNKGNIKGDGDFDFPDNLKEAEEVLGAGIVYKHFMDAYKIFTRKEFHQNWSKIAARREADRLAEARKEFYEAQAEGKFDELDEDTMNIIKKSLKI